MNHQPRPDSVSRRSSRLAGGSGVRREPRRRYSTAAPGEPATFDRLHELLERQPYRLAHWRTAFDEINYRRFFDVNDLGALRMEDPRVFEASHARVLHLIADGNVTGLRIDHPTASSIRRRTSSGSSERSPACDAGRQRRCAGRGRFLHRGREDPGARGTPAGSWPIAGTTGYGFLNAVNGLFVDGDNEDAFRRLYTRLTGRSRIPCRSRLSIASAWSWEARWRASWRCSPAFAQADRASDRRTRDFTLTTLARARSSRSSPAFRSIAPTSARRVSLRPIANHRLRRSIGRGAAIRSCALRCFSSCAACCSPTASERRRTACSRTRQFAMKFQQFSAPVQAKGVEDTASTATTPSCR